MKIYHDWEFYELDMAPISVGMITEDGDELYMEFSDAPWDKILKDSWLKANVVPHLTCMTDGSLGAGFGTKTFKGRIGVISKVNEFFKAAHARSQDQGIELWGYYSAFDHVFLSRLFGRMVDLPWYVPMHTMDVQQEAKRLGLKLDSDQFVQEGEQAHNALADARAIKKMHEYVIQYDKIQSKFNGIQYGNGNTQVNTF